MDDTVTTLPQVLRRAAQRHAERAAIVDGALRQTLPIAPPMVTASVLMAPNASNPKIAAISHSSGCCNW